MEPKWTVETLKAYFDALRADDRLALITAMTANEKRLDSMNEFRQTLSDQSNTFVPRPEYSVLHKSLETKIESNTRLIYIGVGVILTLQFVVGIIVLIATKVI